MQNPQTHSSEVAEIAGLLFKGNQGDFILSHSLHYSEHIYDNSYNGSEYSKLTESISLQKWWIWLPGEDRGRFIPQVRLRRIEGFKSTENDAWESKTPFMRGN